MIEVRDLHKAFGAVKAVDGVSFTAEDGKITGLLGPNGAGKTTTLRMLYTLMKPDHGHVLVDALDVVVAHVLRVFAEQLSTARDRNLRRPALRTFDEFHGRSCERKS